MPRGRCGHCGSADVEGELDLFFCFNCGHHTDILGRPAPKEPLFYAPSHQERRAAGDIDRG
jgi:hypothetical protein